MLLIPVGDLFDEADFAEPHSLRPDEVVLEDPVPQRNAGQEGFQRNNNTRTSATPAHLETPSKPQRTGSLPPPAERVRPNIAPGNHAAGSGPKAQPYRQPPAPAGNQKPATVGPNHSAANQTPLNTTNQGAVTSARPANSETRSPTKPPSPHGSQVPEGELPAGFYSARAAEALNTNPQTAVKSAPAFNPRFESPSIRKTAGFDHSTSAPVSRNTYQIVPPQARGVSPNGGMPPPSSQAGLPAIAAPDLARRNMNSPGFATPATRSPMTTSYRPPTRRSLAASNTNTSNAEQNASASAATGAAALQNANGKRPPLSDMTNVTSASGGDKGYIPDASKRPKIGDGGNGPRPIGAAAGQQSRPPGP